MRNDKIEAFGRELNDLDDRLPKGRSRCFDIGILGGCGVTCPAFIDGECEEPQEIPRQEVIDEHGDDLANDIFMKYKCFGGNALVKQVFSLKFNKETE